MLGRTWARRYDARGQADEAQALLSRRRSRIAPDDSLASCRLASVALRRSGKYAESMQLLRDLIVKQPALATAPTSRWAWRSPTPGSTATRSGCGRRWWSWRPPRPRRVSAKESIDVLEKFLETQ